MSMLGIFLLQTKAMLFAAASGAQGPVWEGQARWGPEGLSRVWPALRLEKRDRKTGPSLPVGQFLPVLIWQLIKLLRPCYIITCFYFRVNVCKLLSPPLSNATHSLPPWGPSS